MTWGSQLGFQSLPQSPLFVPRNYGALHDVPSPLAKSTNHLVKTYGGRAGNHAHRARPDVQSGHMRLSGHQTPLWQAVLTYRQIEVVLGLAFAGSLFRQALPSITIDQAGAVNRGFNRRKYCEQHEQHDAVHSWRPMAPIRMRMAVLCRRSRAKTSCVSTSVSLNNVLDIFYNKHLARQQETWPGFATDTTTTVGTVASEFAVHEGWKCWSTPLRCFRNMVHYHVEDVLQPLKQVVFAQNSLDLAFTGEKS
ncbi:hypothetical protein B0H66DRAFT_527213 [Apodospora peruviana]|uniref:Uncharacterized protein n=1 Tax=Apodospora peruviana TaxID=516989 RepID=A0AAE0IRL3_9PEZI|nr:hypothetical protein B0H66DRAFT_527213 [Apodospora peruviana]